MLWAEFLTSFAKTSVFAVQMRSSVLSISLPRGRLPLATFAVISTGRCAVPLESILIWFLFFSCCYPRWLGAGLVRLWVSETRMLCQCRLGAGLPDC